MEFTLVESTLPERDGTDRSGKELPRQSASLEDSEETAVGDTDEMKQKPTIAQLQKQFDEEYELGIMKQYQFKRSGYTKRRRRRGAVIAGCATSEYAKGTRGDTGS